MSAYIIRRMLLMIPTLLGIMLVSFVVVQFAPGGPVERVIAQLSGSDTGATSRISGSPGGDFGARGQPGGASGVDAVELEISRRAGPRSRIHQEPGEAVRLRQAGLRALLPDAVELSRASISARAISATSRVLQLIKEKLPVSISLGLWMTLLTYLISIPLGIRKAVQDGSQFDVWTSGVIIVGYAIPGFLFAILLIILFAGGSFFDCFPLRGLTSDNWAQLSLVRRRSSTTSGTWRCRSSSMVLGAFATMTLLTKNSFLDEIRKQYVLTARAKGCTERQVLYGHVFRNAMLIVIAGFPGAFVHAFFSGSLLIETIFSLDGLGLLGFESVLNRDYPVVFATLYIFVAGRARREPDLRPHLHLGRSAHRFRDAGGLRWTTARPSTVPETTAQTADGARPCCRSGIASRCRRSTGGAGRTSRRNRRGYWSFWIFLVLFVLSLFAEFIANDKPFYVELRRRAPISRSFVNYPETAFGGDFETAADYRDPYLQKLIAEKGGCMLWPPIRYSYDTHNLDLPTPAPSQPTWMLTEEQCKAVVERKGLTGCSDLEYNWLGTDDQGRDVVARLIYGFRISVLFGLTLTIISSVIGVAAGAVQGYFGGWIDLLFQRFIEIWTSMPSLYLLLIISSVLVPGFFVLLGILLLFSWVSLVGLVRAEFLRGRNFEYVQAARALGVSNRTHHVPPSAAQRHGGDADLPALHPVVVGHDADRARLPRLRPAARLALARRTAVAGQGQHPGAVARPLRLLHRRDHAVAADLHRRGGARRLRPAEDVRVSAMDATTRNCSRSSDLSVAFRQGGARDARGRPRLLRHQEGRDRGAGRRIRLGQIGHRAVGPEAPALSGRAPSVRPIRFKGQDLLHLPEDEMRHVRGNDITIIFQEPMTSLNPLHTIEKQIGEILLLHQGLTGAAARARTLELLTQVGIPEPETRLASYPHQLSGGQRQRVMIAMALANEPDLLIADEPTTALDVTVQAQILALLKDLQTRLGMAMLFITHDLGIVRKIADRSA